MFRRKLVPIHKKQRILIITSLSCVGQQIVQNTVLHLLDFYEFINPCHELTLSKLDKTLVVS
jgi:hypothetical protein